MIHLNFLKRVKFVCVQNQLLSRIYSVSMDIIWNYFIKSIYMTDFLSGRMSESFRVILKENFGISDSHEYDYVRLENYGANMRKNLSTFYVIRKISLSSTTSG